MLSLALPSSRRRLAGTSSHYQRVGQGKGLGKGLGKRSAPVDLPVLQTVLRPAWSPCSGSAVQSKNKIIFAETSQVRCHLSARGGRRLETYRRMADA